MSIPRMFIYVALVALTIPLIASPSFAAPSQSLGQTTTSQPVASAANAGDQPDATCPAGGQCFTDVTSGNPFYAFVNRIYQQDLVSGYPCSGPGEPCDAQNRPYYRPINNVTRQQMAKFIDNARHLPGIDIEVSGGTVPIIAHNNTGTAIAAYSTSGQALTVQSGNQSAIYAQSGEAAVVSAYSTGSTNASYGVYGNGNTGVYGGGTLGVVGVGASSGVSGTSPSGIGVYGASTGGPGVSGTSTNSDGVVGSSDAHAGVMGQSIGGDGVDGTSGGGFGVSGTSDSGGGVYGFSYQHTGVHGESHSGNGVDGVSQYYDGVSGISGSGYGVYGTSTSGYAGYFQGNVHVTGTCCQAAEGSFTIDDPTDPANKYLNQSAVASSAMLDLYTGHVTLDANGEAWVEMPSWFQALNEDFDYQLTCLGGYAPVYVAQEIQNNRFQIAGGKPGLKVSWQVTGTRHDPYAQQHPIPTEQNKPAGEQGTYLHPELYGQPDSKRVPTGK
jgi:hypothetical protein